MAKKTPKNQTPLRDISALSGAVRFSQYIDASCFEHICTVGASEDLEKFIISKTHNEKKMAQTHLIYVLVVNDLIFKIGHSTDNFKGRLGSYNAGTKSNRDSGTASTTNFFVLQSLINIGLDVEVYGFYPEKKEWSWLGEANKEPFPSTKTIEGIFLRRYIEEYKNLPIGCTQT